MNQTMTSEPRSRLHLWISLGLAVATLAVYWQVVGHDFINFDDQEYVTENPHVQSGVTVQGIIWAFTTRAASNWHPLTWISHMLDYQIWGLKAGPYKLTSVLLHVASTLLLFSVLRRMTGSLWKSAFVAALFALHPLHVESVAWVSERKDTLSTLFWMLTMLAYVRYVEKPGGWRYSLVLLTFALGLLAKPMLITLPFVLLLMDYWPLQRFTRSQQARTASSRGKKGSAAKGQRALVVQLVREKLPFVVLVLGSSIVTFIVQQKYGAVAPIESISLSTRITNALVSYASYLVNMVWPMNLAMFYPYDNALPGWKIGSSLLLLSLISWICIRQRRSRPYLIVGWLWYLGTLVPVIGLVQVGTQSMADRYTYITLIGIFMMIAWGAPDLLSRWRRRAIALPVASGLLIAGCAVLTFYQIPYWHDSFVLYDHALAVTSGNHLAHNNLGAALFAQGKIQEAKTQFIEALEASPNDPGAHNNLGTALGAEHKVDSAIVEYREALRLNPNYADAQKNLGVALTEKGQLAEARPHLLEALRIKPDVAEIHENYASLLAKEGNTRDAIAQYEEALRLNPRRFESESSLAFLLASQGKLNEAIPHLSAAVRINPDNSDAQTNLGNLFANQGKFDSAAAHLREALRVNPRLPLAQAGLGSVLSKQGKYDEAIEHFSDALRINPDDAASHYGIGVALAKQGKKTEATSQLTEALRLNPGLADARAQLDSLQKQGVKPRAAR